MSLPVVTHLGARCHCFGARCHSFGARCHSFGAPCHSPSPSHPPSPGLFKPPLPEIGTALEAAFPRASLVHGIQGVLSCRVAENTHTKPHSFPGAVLGATTLPSSGKLCTHRQDLGLRDGGEGLELAGEAQLLAMVRQHERHLEAAHAQPG